jgi:hypothetical protein
VPDDVKTLLQNFPAILRTGDVKPTPHHIPSRKIANCQSRIQKVRICWFCPQIKITMGFSFAHGFQKRWIVAALWQLPPFKFGDNP